MKAGNFRYPIKIYNPVTYKDEYGEEKTEYQFYCSTKSSINWRAGEKHIQSFDQFIPNTIELIVRHYIKIQDNTRIELDNKMYEVVSYHRDLKYRDIVIIVQEVNE